MKLDRYDVALVNATVKKDEVRPILENVYLNQGKLTAADGFMLVNREAEVTSKEKDKTALIPAAMLKTIKTSPKKQATLSINGDAIEVSYQTDLGENIDFNPTLQFHQYKATKGYPDVSHLWPTETEKTAHIALGVGLLKKLLSCLPDEGILRMGITNPSAPLEIECSNMDRPIRALIMPMLIDWADFKWHREPKADKS